MNSTGLGRGLDSLLPPKKNKQAELKRIAVDEIEPNPNQPRKNFDPEKLAELTRSIKKQGVIEPVVVRPRQGEKYPLVAGERRWRAACQAGLDNIPAIIRDLDDDQALTVALIENIQRENLNPIEEARAYRRLQKKQNWIRQQLAEAVAKSRSAIANRIRLLDLPMSVKKMIGQQKLSAGHARALLPLDDADKITRLAEKIVKNDYSVRQTEKAVKKLMAADEQQETGGEKKQPPTHYQHLEAELEEAIGAPVEIESKNRRQGHIRIFFNNPDEFEMLRNRLKNIITPEDR
ncbi:MAG: ParB/RepB/Spo0J family partition protein [bacterium]